MAHRASLSILGGLLLTHVFTQAPAIQWQKCLGGSGLDQATSIQQITDGGYIVAGWTGSNDGDIIGNHGADDFWVVKLDGAGTLVWQKALGGSDDDRANSIQQTSDGGYIVAGYTLSSDGDVTGNHGGFDCWIVKLDAAGYLIWQKTLGGSGGDQASSIRQTTDGGYIVAGWTGSNDGDVSGNNGLNDVWVVKLDASGSIIWQNALGGSYNDDAASVQQIGSGEYIVAGHTDSNDGDVFGNNGGTDLWVVKLVATGGMLWQRSLGGGLTDVAYSIKETSDGGYIVAGNTYSNDGDVSGNHGGTDSWVVKLDAVGNTVWQNALGGSNTEVANSIQQTSDGGYIVGGRTSSNDGDISSNHGLSDAWVVKQDGAGNLLWEKSLGGSESDVAGSIQQTNDGGYIVAGTTVSNDGDVSGNHGGTDFWVVKLDSTNTGVEEMHASSFTILPNPSDGLVLVNTGRNLSNASITLTDAMGRELLREQMKGHEQVLDLRDRSKGIYVLILRSEQMISVQRLVVE